MQSDAVRLLAQCVASSDDETVRHALRALSLLAGDRTCNLRGEVCDDSYLTLSCACMCVRVAGV